MIRRGLLWLIILSMMGSGGTPASAAIPTQTNYQGKLLDSSGTPRNGSYSITFSIWDASSGGTQLWTETQGSVSVSNGAFSVRLGSANALTSTVFDGDTRYLQVQIGGETATSRQRLVTSPYAFRAAIADDVSAGSANYIQNSNSLQSGATFYVSSGTVSGPFAVEGVITAGSSRVPITTASGLLDAEQLSGTLPSAQFAGLYSSSVTLSNSLNSFTGNGSGLTNVLASHLMPGDTNYIQNSATLQSGATFYVSSGTVAGSLTVYGSAILGGAPTTDDVIVRSNLNVTGSGPHIFNGDIRVNGNDLLDSAGTTRVSLGSNVVVNGALQGGGGQFGVNFSTPGIFVGNANGDNFVAFPFTAGNPVTNRDIVIISGANTVDRTTSGNSTAGIGIAVNSAGSGETVYVAMMGIVTNVIANGTIAAGTGRVCTSTSAGRVQTCNTDGAVVGKALTGTTAAGQTLTVLVTLGY